MEVLKIQKRIWIRSGNILELDKREIGLLNLVLSKIKYYYNELHGTRAMYKYPLNLYRLKKLCNRNSLAITKAIYVLANTVPEGSNNDEEPPIYFDRVQSEKNKSHRAYRIFLRKR